MRLQEANTEFRTQRDHRPYTPGHERKINILKEAAFGRSQPLRQTSGGCPRARARLAPPAPPPPPSPATMFPKLSQDPGTLAPKGSDGRRLGNSVHPAGFLWAANPHPWPETGAARVGWGGSAEPAQGCFLRTQVESLADFPRRSNALGLRPRRQLSRGRPLLPRCRLSQSCRCRQLCAGSRPSRPRQVRS